MKQTNQREITLYVFLNTNNSNRTNNKKMDARTVRPYQSSEFHSARPLLSPH